MKRAISTFFIVLAVVLGAPASTVQADEAPPSAKDLEAAKKAFKAGKELHAKGKLPDAIEKFKESYRLSKNPLLLYNIGITMQEAGMEDLALFYFRKFLAEAPPDAEQRPVVVEAVKALEAKFNIGTKPDPNANKPDPNANKPDPNANKPDPNANKPVVCKPAGTFNAEAFQHQVVDAAPPSKPLDVTAFVPEDSCFVVTLFFRTAGEGRFTAKVMKWRYKELVARVPRTKMIGSAVQYYIEVKDSGGNLVTRSAKSTSPNQVLLEAGAAERFYPDVTDDGDAKLTPADVRKRDDDDDPLNANKPRRTDDDIVIQPVTQGPPGNGFLDAGSTKFSALKWGSTATAGVFLGLGVFSFIQAGKYAKALEDDSAGCGAPPCRKFDSTSSGYEDTGKRYETFYKVGVGIGVAASLAAGYFWFRDLTAKKRGEVKISKTAPKDETSSWVVVPSAGDGYAGAAAAVRF